MIKKLVTFHRYLIDYLKHGEYLFLLTSIKYIVFKRTTRKNRFYTSSVGFFFSRKGTLDFQFANYAYEWNVKQFIFKHYKDYNIFLDIGANIGTYSLLLAKMGLKCYAFEPARENFLAFKINILLNDLGDKITPYNFGLGSKNCEEDFVFETINTGASHLLSSAHFDTSVVGPKKNEKVDIKTLDSIINQLNLNKTDRIIIKIDTEGMEPMVLQGAQGFINDYPNILFIIEWKLSGLEEIKNYFTNPEEFEFVLVDNMNVAVKKRNVIT
jgi:FkbM family methyltransferase